LIADIISKEFMPFTKRQLYTSNASNIQKYNFELKSRDEHLKDLQSGAEFDLLIVGGGANGAGVVLDAASRGLKCAVIDKYDFASGTSSKSTKMAHGGIRYF
jgi:glycerol-3-phosphate dehydrogenase